MSVEKAIISWIEDHYWDSLESQKDLILKHIKQCPALTELEAATQEPDIEKLSAAVHRAYCQHYLESHHEEYWTKGDYSKLNEVTKEIDRCTVRAVLAELEAAESKQEPTELLSDVKLIIETAIQEGRETGYSPTAEEWNNISKLCDHNDSLQEQLAARDKLLEEISTKHNLLPYFAGTECDCDHDVGITLCMSCGAKEIIRRIEQTLKGE